MQKVCRNCCKIFCPQRNEVTTCNKQITFVTRMLQEIDEKVKTENLIQTSILANPENKHERKLKIHKKGVNKMVVDDMEQSLVLLQNIDDFIMAIDDTEKKLRTALYNKEGERDDLLHEVEFGKKNKLSIGERAKVYSMLEKVLQERRILKDKIDFINTIKPYANKFITKGMSAETKQTIENINRLKNNQETRVYTPRVLKDLKCAKKKKEE